MTCTSLSALFATIWFTGLLSGGVTLPNLGISVLQKPETIKWKGTSESISCHIKAFTQVERIMVTWLQDNETVIQSEKIEMSDSRSSVSGAVFNASLDLLSVRLNHSGMYYCTARVNLPILGAVEYGTGTYVYVGSNSTTVTAPSPTPVTVTANPYKDTLMVSLTSGLGCVLLIICIVCVIHIHYKGHSRIEPKAKEAVVDATHETTCPETQESVVYAALNIPRDSVKSRNENSAALPLTSVIRTEVTYSEVHIKKRPKDEG